MNHLENEKKTSRREFLSTIAMIAGVVASYGLLTLQGFLFVMPRRLKSRTRKVFVGNLSSFKNGQVTSYTDPFGNELLLRRNKDGLQAFSSRCPHLGCRVRWETDESRFFCPCHRGVFNADGVGTSGPPADAGQRLEEVPLVVDEKSGVVFVEVPDKELG